MPNKMNYPQNIIDNFWSKVNYPGNDIDCWEWIAAKGSNRRVYGTFSIKSSQYHKTFRAHRFAWEFYNGPIPDKLLVLHKCDNPPCCNPEHCQNISITLIARQFNVTTQSIYDIRKGKFWSHII
jgi:hypothetical protein